MQLQFSHSVRTPYPIHVTWEVSFPRQPVAKDSRLLAIFGASYLPLNSMGVHHGSSRKHHPT